MSSLHANAHDVVPAGTVPVLVPINLVVSSDDRFDMRFELFHVYPTGVLVEAVVRARTLSLDEQDRIADEIYGFRLNTGDSAPEIRVFVEGRAGGGGEADGRGNSPEPTLYPWGVRGSGDLWRFSFWVSPLPMTGSLVLEVTWRDRDIDAVRAGVIAGSTLRDAASRAVELWPEPPTGEHSYRGVV